MTSTRFEIRPGAYYDSVVLMQLQRALAGLAGVEEAGVVMATEANRALLEDRGLVPDGAETAGSDDLLIVVRAEKADLAEGALAQVDDLLKQRAQGPRRGFTPKSLRAAADARPEAAWTLISVPGRFAAGVAQEALALGRHVFLYSDNVSVEDEVKLKKSASAKGLLVMGPDCGTAIVNGVGLGFANRVRRGPIGLVAASGTGLQAVSVRVHQLGSGVSQAIGTGGRDLSEAVGAITARQALSILRRDENTSVIALISKPPAPQVAAALLAAARSTGKPVVVHFLGYAAPAPRIGNLHFARNLAETADLAVRLADEASESQAARSSKEPAKGKYLRGLFSGGTLAYEALQGLQAFLSPIYSNAPIHPWQQLENPLHSQAHSIIDLGEDEFTVGRLHPMMDNELRIRRMHLEASDPDVAVLLIDVVLGEGAHPDPASELAPAIRTIHESGQAQVVAIVVGTDEDPQKLEDQISQLEAAGTAVFRDTMQAVEECLVRLQPVVPSEGVEIDLAGFQKPLSAINVGVESFAVSLEAQAADVVHVDWSPPAGGNERLMDILAKMKS